MSADFKTRRCDPWEYRVWMSPPFLKSLACLHGFCAGEIGSAMILVPLPEKLADHLLDRYFLDVDVANIASLE